MEQIHKSYKFCLYPTQKQEELLLKHFGCTRWVYNHFLYEHNIQYKNKEKTNNYYQNAAKNYGLRIYRMVVPSTQMEAQIRLPRGEAQACEICRSI